MIKKAKKKGERSARERRQEYIKEREFGHNTKGFQTRPSVVIYRCNENNVRRQGSG